jgi:catechol 2,3-dioxygenase-like lactoylglutathione lyase family enzyme
MDHIAHMSWDAGIEMMCPFPDTPMAEYVEKHGEGLVGVVFRVDQIEEAKTTIDELGLDISLTIEYDQQQIDEFHGGRFTKYKEYVLAPRSCGVGTFVIGQLDPVSTASEWHNGPKPGPTALGVDRVIIAVRDMDKGKEFYSKLLGATWHDGDSETAAQYGQLAAFSWDAGIEMISPLPGTPFAAHLEKTGDGLVGVVFRIDDFEKAGAAIADAGLQVGSTVDYSQDEIDKFLQGRFKNYREYILAPGSCGTGTVVIGQIDPRS